MSRSVLFTGSDLASSIAASTSGDSYVLTINDGTSSTSVTYDVTTASGVATVDQLVTRFQTANGAPLAGAAARNVVFSVDNGQLKVSQSQGGSSANDFTISWRLQMLMELQIPPSITQRLLQLV